MLSSTTPENISLRQKYGRGLGRIRLGKKQLAVYMKLEGVPEGYYVVFDHPQNPEPQVETETIDGVQIRSYVIPVIQKPPSSA